MSERLSNSLWGPNVLLFLEFINILSILFYNFIELIILLYTFLVISLAQHKEYIIWWISFFLVFICLTCFYLCKCFWKSLKHLFRCYYLEFKGDFVPFRSLFKSMMFSTIPIILSGFSALRISFLLKEFLKLLNEPLTLFSALLYLN